MSGVQSWAQERLPDAPTPTLVGEQLAAYSSSLEFAPKPLAEGVHATDSKAKLREDQLNVEEHQRVLGIVPNFYTVYGSNIAPLTTKQKFRLAWKSELDPENL